MMLPDNLTHGSMSTQVDTVTTLIPRWKMLFRRKFQARRRMTREEKAAEELEWRRINEEIELSAEGVEPLLGAYSGYSVEVTAMLIFPFLNMFMMWFPMVRRSVRFLQFLNLKLRRWRQRNATPTRRRRRGCQSVCASRERAAAVS